MTSDSLRSLLPLSRFRGIVVSLILGACLLPLIATPADAATTKLPVACQKVFAEVVNADKVYIALQYGVVKAATDYVASNSLSNRLLYNDSFIKAIQAASAELNIAIKNPKCYPVKNITGYLANVKSNLKQIANIYTANVNGQLVGDPQKMTTFKPVGLLK